MNYKKEFIEFMVRAGVLTFGDFVTKSGRNTPYFINTGNYRTGEQIGKLGKFYAECIEENMIKGNISPDIDALFGPAYKGIPIAVSTAISMSSIYGREINYCFNRKEAKDHGEGGDMVGYRLRDQDKVLIIEDVITAGTAVRETLPLLRAAADVKIEGLVISVDRMEKGQGLRTAIQEIQDEFGIRTFPIVTVKDIIDALFDVEIDGKIFINKTTKEKMLQYMEMYCI